MRAVGTHFFGTDGIRGEANGDLTAFLALQIGTIVGHHFYKKGQPNEVIIGKDTRRSGYMIEDSLVAGLLSAGMQVRQAGPIPTPGLAMLVLSYGASLGFMITASHNLYGDNGIKIFGPDGYKLPDNLQQDIEQSIGGDLTKFLVPGSEIGRAERIEDAQGRYIEFAKHTLPKHRGGSGNGRFRGLRVAVDCANGASYKVGPRVLYELGADVVPIGISPDGYNINAGVGSTSLDAIKAKVREVRADIGIAFDGDADRLIIVDENSDEVNGDQLLALIAEEWNQDGRLAKQHVAATVMSNLGLDDYLEALGIKVSRTSVGDRYVLEEMRKQELNLGGEQSGHIIMSDYTTTGDGLIAALQVLSMLKAKDKPMSELAHRFEPYPQKRQDIRYKKGTKPLSNPEVEKLIKDGIEKLGKKGLIVRSSGTEPLIRIMAQHQNLALVDEVVGNISAAVERVV